jgi:hypothetical protein
MEEYPSRVHRLRDEICHMLQTRSMSQILATITDEKQRHFCRNMGELVPEFSLSIRQVTVMVTAVPGRNQACYWLPYSENLPAANDSALNSHVCRKIYAFLRE